MAQAVTDQQKVLAMLYALDPVQVALTRQRIESRLWSQLTSLRETLQRWARRRASIRALENLPDWQLRDIGIPRGQITKVVDTIISQERA